MSQRTKSLKKKKAFFGFLSFSLWIGTLLFLAIYAFCSVGNAEEVAKEGMEILSTEAKDVLIGLGTTACIAILGTIIIKDKIRTVIYMLSLILSVILFKETGMYVVLAIWFIDEYVICRLFKHYCHLVQINKEIDLRESK